MATPPTGPIPALPQHLPRVRLRRDPWTQPSSGRTYISENIEIERDGQWISICERFLPLAGRSFSGEMTRWYTGQELLTNTTLRDHLGPDIVAFLDFVTRELLTANGTVPRAHAQMHAVAQQLGLESLESSNAATVAASADAAAQRRASGAATTTPSATTAAQNGGPSEGPSSAANAADALTEPMATLTVGVAVESDPEMPALDSGSGESSDEGYLTSYTTDTDQ